MPAGMTPAKLDFRDQTPYSATYGDVYHSIGGELSDIPPVHELRQRAARTLDHTLSIRVAVHLQAPHTVPRSEGKAVRVVEKS